MLAIIAILAIIAHQFSTPILDIIAILAKP